MAKVKTFTNPQYSNAEGSQIDITKPDGVRTTLTADDPWTADAFAETVAGKYGKIAAYETPASNASIVRQTIIRIYNQRIDLALEGKGQSMLREATYLQFLSASGKDLTLDQKNEVSMFDAINSWESAMIEAREKLIKGGDVQPALIDASWPSPPSGLTDFLTGF